MNKDEILIGRKVDGDNYLVDNTYSSVSRVHAKIIRENNSYIIEDLDSANGTYVNGHRVCRKKITLTDSVYLGGADHFCLPIKEVINMFPMTDDDYRDKILNLEYIYESYQAKSTSLQTKLQEDMMIKRMLPSTVLGSLTAVLAVLCGDDPTTKVAIGVIGAVLSVIVFFVAAKWATSSNLKIKEELRLLNEKFELEYVCPVCGASYKGKSWEFIKRGGKCPVCKKNFIIN